MLLSSWPRVAMAVMAMATGGSVAVAMPSAPASATAAAPAQSLDACGRLALLQAEAMKASSPDSVPADFPLPVRETWECAQSIKFVPDDALQFLSVAKQYTQFLSTLAFLKTPPLSYQQPAVDVLARLDTIGLKVQNGNYQSQYDFDEDIMKLVIAAHEGHFEMSEGVTRIFNYKLNDSIVAFSSDGKELPKVYAYSDINRTDNVGAAFQPSPIRIIENMDIFEYVISIGGQSPIRALEDHTTWNMMMTDVAWDFDETSQSKGLQPVFSFFQQRTLYFGESVKGVFENGTSFEWPFQGISQAPLAGMRSASDIYHNFIVAANQSSTNHSSASATSALPTGSPAVQPSVASASGTHRQSSSAAPAGPSLTAVPFPNYPRNPIVLQDQFGQGGTVSGYILSDISVGVLSLPSFASDTVGAPSKTFTDAVASFITKARAAGVKKVVIDVSSNGGGTVTLGYDTFRRFFPNIFPSLGFRIRAQPGVQAMGKTLSGIIATDGRGFNLSDVKQWEKILEPSFPLGAPFLLHAQSGGEFSSWEDYIGPVAANGDTFSETAQVNFSNPVMVVSDSDPVPIAGFLNDTLDYAEPPWRAEDIILLTDGQCASTCAVFAELLKTNAGVKNVVLGGQPQHGPMQAVGATRGSLEEDWTTIEAWAALVRRMAAEPGDGPATLRALNISAADLAALPPALSAARYALDGSVNMEDAIRAAAPSTPLSFTYQPADCRLFYTRAMITDVTQAWRAAATVLAGDFSACVPGSVGVLGSQPNSTSTSAAPADAGAAAAAAAATTSASKGPSTSSSTSSAATSGRAGKDMLGLAVVLATTILLGLGPF